MPTILLDKEREIALDLNAMIAFKKLTGKNLLDAATIAQSMGEKDAEILRALIYSLLVSKNPDLTPEKVGALVNSDNMSSLLNELLAIYEEKGAGEDDNPLPPGGPSLPVIPDSPEKK